METKNIMSTTMAIAPARSFTEEMKIGKMTYIVNTSFDETARETAEQKFLRVVTDRVAAEMKVGTLTI